MLLEKLKVWFDQLIETLTFEDHLAKDELLIPIRVEQDPRDMRGKTYSSRQ